MLYFFRRLRRKLIQEGKLRRYLFYAVGEILLVMVGILLALQVNNWNQRKRNSIKEQIILNELKENLQSNIRQFHSNITWEENRIEGIIRVLDFLRSKGTWNDTIAEDIRWLRLREEFLISTSAYQSLNSNGFDLISSDSIRKEIIRLFDVTYAISTDRVTEFSMEMFSVRDQYYNSFFKWDPETKRIELNSNESLFDTKEIENMFSHLLFYKEYVIQFNEEAISETAMLIQLLEAELEEF